MRLHGCGSCLWLNISLEQGVRDLVNGSGCAGCRPNKGKWIRGWVTYPQSFGMLRGVSIGCGMGAVKIIRPLIFDQTTAASPPLVGAVRTTASSPSNEVVLSDLCCEAVLGPPEGRPLAWGSATVKATRLPYCGSRLGSFRMACGSRGGLQVP